MADNITDARARKREYLAGCGVAVLLIALAFAVLAYGVSGTVRRGVRVSGAEARAALQLRYNNLQTRGLLDEGDEPAIERLIRMASRRSSSYYAVTLCDKLLEAAYRDESLDSVEAEQARIIADFLDQNPSPGPKDISRLMVDYPWLAQLYDGQGQSRPSSPALQGRG